MRIWYTTLVMVLAGLTVVGMATLRPEKPPRAEGRKEPTTQETAAAGAEVAIVAVEAPLAKPLPKARAVVFFRDAATPRQEKGTRLRSARYDISQKIAFQDASREWVRLLFDYVEHDRQEADGGEAITEYHYCEVGRGQIVLGRAEAGLAVELARVAPYRFPEGREFEVKLLRRRMQIAVLVDEVPVCTTYGEYVDDGLVGVSFDGEVTPPAPKVRSYPDILFADDFMREPKDASSWTPVGDTPQHAFEIKSMKHPLLSANAFDLMAAGRGVMVTAGDPHWDNYHYRVSAWGPVNSALGLIIAYRDPDNMVRFEWTAKKLDRERQVVDQGERRLVLLAGGHRLVLGVEPGGFLPHQWYRLAADCEFGRVRVRVDGQEFFDVSDSRIIGGAIGLWADVPPVPLEMLEAYTAKLQQKHNEKFRLMLQHAVFDDVRVESIERYRFDFQGEERRLTAGFRTGQGRWLVGGGKLQAQAPRPSRALFGLLNWRDATVQSSLEVPPGAKAGLVLRYLDEANRLEALVDTATGKARLVRVLPTGSQVVDEKPLPGRQEGGAFSGSMRAASVRGHMAVQVGRDLVLECFDRDLGLGRVGLACEGQARFANLLIELPQSAPAGTQNAVFSAEQTMRTFASTMSEWYPSTNTGKNHLTDPWGKPVTIYWHRARFPGDVELSVEPQTFTDHPPDNKYQIVLAVSKDGEGRYNGYNLVMEGARRKITPAEGEEGEDALAGEAREKGRYEPLGAEKHRLHLALWRQGELWRKGDLEHLGRIDQVSLRRAGSFIILYVNGQPQFVARDENPLPGSKVAFYGYGLEFRREAVRVASPAAVDYDFSGAPVEWRASEGAIAVVADRWQCDPRWSFFSLRSQTVDLKAHLVKERPEWEKIACLWNKRRFKGEVTIECYIGPKMNQERPPGYLHMRDLCFQLAPESKSLKQGYTFMFGGRKNRGSYILRNGVEVAHGGPAERIPVASNIHRRWFYVRIEKSGGTLAFYVDDFVKLHYEDREPLDVSRFAIWTYDCGMMIGRVRLSGADWSALEDPGTEPGGFQDCPVSDED